MKERSEKQKAWDKRLGENSSKRARKTKSKGTPPFNGEHGRVVAKFPHRLKQGVWQLHIYKFATTLNSQAQKKTYLAAKLYNSGKCERKANYWLSVYVPMHVRPTRMGSDWSLLETIEGQSLSDEVFNVLTTYLSKDMHKSDETLLREERRGFLSKGEHLQFLERRLAKAEDTVKGLRVELVRVRDSHFVAEHAEEPTETPKRAPCLADLTGD